MKHSFFAATIAVILFAAGCQKTEIMNQSGTAIGFETITGKLTKAENPDAVGLETLQRYGFKVWVYRNFEDEYFAGDGNGLNAIYDGMEALPITWNTTSSKWTTSKDYYWPGANKQLKFYAVSCNEDADNGFPLTGAVTITNNETATGTTKVTDFVINELADNDLMIADPIVQAQQDATNGNTVKPVFRHTLTKVQFNFKTDASTMEAHPVYIQSIETSALKTKGSITLPASAGTSPWILDDATTDEFVDNNNTAIVLPTEEKDGATTEIVIDGEDAANKDRLGLTLTADYQTLDTWLLLPQEIGASQGVEGATVTVTYIIKNRQFTKTFPLYADNLTKWDVNQFVKYNVTIAPNLISFEPSVEDWTETNVTVGDSGVSVDPEEDEEEPTPDPEQN